MEKNDETKNQIEKENRDYKESGQRFGLQPPRKAVKSQQMLGRGSGISKAGVQKKKLSNYTKAK